MIIEKLVYGKQDFKIWKMKEHNKMKIIERKQINIKQN